MPLVLPRVLRAGCPPAPGSSLGSGLEAAINSAFLPLLLPRCAAGLDLIRVL